MPGRLRADWCDVVDVNSRAVKSSSHLQIWSEDGWVEADSPFVQPKREAIGAEEVRRSELDELVPLHRLASGAHITGKGVLKVLRA